MRKFGWFFVFIVIVYFSWLTFSCQLKYLRPRAARKRNKEDHYQDLTCIMKKVQYNYIKIYY